jgi:hypothetical protein
VEGKGALLHLLEADDCSVESFGLLAGEPDLNQCPLLRLLKRSLHAFGLHLLAVVAGGLLLALVSVVVAGELEDPVGVDETDVVDIVSGALHDLVVYHPLGIHHAPD